MQRHTLIRRLFEHMWKQRVLFLICIALTVIPFFWMKPGEMDIGGDSSRLYFYDPVAFIRHMSLYAVSPDAQRSVEPSFFYLPYVGSLAVLKSIIDSPYILISLESAIKLILAFLSIYWTIIELTHTNIGKKSNFSETSAIVAGLFYIFTPSVIGNWAKAIVTINQIFLNPLMFYLILKFFLTHRRKYLWLLLGISFLFAPNFSLAGAPAFFAFYPICILFLVLYTVIVRKRSLPWTDMLGGALLFLGLQAFQLFPQIQSLFDPGSFSHTRVFDPQSIIVEGINYFSSVLPNAKVSWFILLPSYSKNFLLVSLIAPMTICFAFMFDGVKKNRTLFLTSLFFFFTLFLVAANITNTWVTIYKHLFYIPGFSMFRNFSGQWQFVYSFFYAILFGQSLAIVSSKLAGKLSVPLAAFIGIVMIGSATPFLNGDLVNPAPFDTEANVHVVTRMDPNYEKTLAFVREMPGEGKILSLPFSDGFYQVLHGTNDGAYVGPSMISLLTGKADYVGYSMLPPFPEVFYRLAKERNYVALKRLFGLLNIKYIFYNSDPRIYDQTFPRAPFSYVRNYLPKTHKEMADFVAHLVKNKVYGNSHYALYEIDSDVYLPEAYVPKAIVSYENNQDDWYGANASFFINSPNNEPRVSFIEKQTCLVIFSTKQCENKEFSIESTYPKIGYRRISPVKYVISVSEAQMPYVLIFSQKFNRNWKVYVSKNTTEGFQVLQNYFNGDITVGPYQQEFFSSNTFETLRHKSLPEASHFMVNGYANAWLIRPEDTNGNARYNLIMEMTGQREFWFGALISALTLSAIALYAMWVAYKKLL